MSFNSSFGPGEPFIIVGSSSSDSLDGSCDVFLILRCVVLDSNVINRFLGSG